MPKINPTPDMIEERCLKIQATWDEDTRISRKTGLPKKVRSSWLPPVIAMDEFTAAVMETFNNSGEH